MEKRNIQLFTATYHVDECLNEIRECLECGWTGMGFKTVVFEEKWKEYTGLNNAYFLNSATAGLNMAVDILMEENGWQEGDEIITTPITFVSSNHCIPLAGLKAVFADIDDTNCLAPESVKERITERTKAVMFVGVGGNSGHYSEIVKICKEKNLKLILDASHMAGTRISGEIPGKEADVVVYSFQAVKNLPTADSGMVCFKEKKYDEIARKKGWLGISKDTYTRTENVGEYKWKYDVEYVGQKYHGNSVIAAIALVQLKYLEQDNAYRKQLVKWYKEYLSGREEWIQFVTVPDECDSACHLFQVLVDGRDETILALNQEGVYPGVHYNDNTLYKMYAYAQGSCPYASYVSNHVISLPMHLRLTRDDVKYISTRLIRIQTEIHSRM